MSAVKAAALPLASALAFAGAASAHVVMTQNQAKAGSYFAARFQVGHGCSGSATTALRVEIPAGMASARPQPKPGWTLEVVKADAATAAKPGEGVAAVIWRGRLPDDQFDDFGLLMKLPEQVGTLYFPVIQTCETGQSQWTETPGPGEDAHGLARPAPALTLTPGDAVAHHHM